MRKITSGEMLCGMEFFRNNIFTRESIDRAEEAFSRLVREGIFEDLHSTSTVEMERLIDTILALEDFTTIQEYLKQQNPNLLAFLFARVQHAVRILQNHKNEPLPFQSHPRTLMRWALVDFWNGSRSAG